MVEAIRGRTGRRAPSPLSATLPCAFSFLPLVPGLSGPRTLSLRQQPCAKNSGARRSATNCPQATPKDSARRSLTGLSGWDSARVCLCARRGIGVRSGGASGGARPQPLRPARQGVDRSRIRGVLCPIGRGNRRNQTPLRAERDGPRARPRRVRGGRERDAVPEAWGKVTAGARESKARAGAAAESPSLGAIRCAARQFGASPCVGEDSCQNLTVAARNSGNR